MQTPRLQTQPSCEQLAGGGNCAPVRWTGGYSPPSHRKWRAGHTPLLRVRGAEKRSTWRIPPKPLPRIAPSQSNGQTSGTSGSPIVRSWAVARMVEDCTRSRGNLSTRVFQMLSGGKTGQPATVGPPETLADGCVCAGRSLANQSMTNKTPRQNTYIEAITVVVVQTISTGV